MADQIRYDLLTQQALRGVVRTVLTDAAKKGLPGDHHFFITFDTLADGVRMPERLRAQFPESMTIVLQHQFWNLTVGERSFDVELTFGGIMEKLGIPFDAINGFFDPSVQFGLQFEEVTETGNRAAPANAQDAPSKKKKLPTSVPAVAAPAKAPRTLTPVAADTAPPPDRPAGGGAEVVRLDRFRKK
jgi:hypothetical protein